MKVCGFPNTHFFGHSVPGILPHASSDARWGNRLPICVILKLCTYLQYLRQSSTSRTHGHSAFILRSNPPQGHPSHDPVVTLTLDNPERPLFHCHITSCLRVGMPDDVLHSG